MTSSTSTGRCSSFITPPPLTVGSRADPGNACRALGGGGPASGRPSDAEASDRRGECRGVLEAPAIDIPAGGCPDLGVVTGSDDDRLRIEAGHLAEVARDEDPALTIEGRLDGPGEDEPGESA